MNSELWINIYLLIFAEIPVDQFSSNFDKYNVKQIPTWTTLSMRISKYMFGGYNHQIFCIVSELTTNFELQQLFTSQNWRQITSNL